MPLTGSTVTRRQLGRWLRELRRAAGKTEADVEEANLASRVKLWRMETGKSAIKNGDVRALCWLYGVDHATTDALANLADATTGHGWWEDFEVVPTRNGLYLALEAMAESIAIYEAERIPALLQTPDYMRALGSASDSDVQLELERQAALTARTPPLRLTAVLGEGALTRRIGSAATMNTQVDRLRELAQQQTHIDIRVLPWQAGAHPAMNGGSFNILDFSDADDPPVVHCESHTGARYLERSADLAEYRRLFARIYRQATPITELRIARQRA